MYIIFIVSLTPYVYSNHKYLINFDVIVKKML